METAAIIVNWNGYKDTVECLSSLFENCKDLEIVVVDNDSQDGSVEKIEKYFLTNKIIYDVYEEDDIRAQPCVQKTYRSSPFKVSLIKGKKNHGFAGGNNLGILHVEKCSSVKYVWLLNNDTVIDSHSLPAMVKRMDVNARNGFVGSVARYYDNPEVIQCFGGGWIFPILGKSKLCMKNQPIDAVDSVSTSSPDYLMGVSLLIRREVIDSIGLMDEDYFMYSEEADWQLRAKRSGWLLDVAPDSFVYHKDSGSTKGKRHLFHYYRCRSAILYAKKNYGNMFATFASLNLMLITIFQEISVPTNIKFALKGIFEGLTWKN